MNLPAHGQIITFSQVPAGSYCTAGVAYRVDRPKNKGDFYFRNVEAGSGTSDKAWAVAKSKWSVQ